MPCGPTPASSRGSPFHSLGLDCLLRRRYPSMEINGIAHIQLTVNDLRRAMPFYEKVLGFMGMKAVVKAPNQLYMIGGRTAVAVTRSSEENRKHAFDQRRVGLHHICFRARSR